jgi:DNA-directed RNA polymerase sigma subunit (sigma70/sigma32)
MSELSLDELNQHILTLSLPAQLELHSNLSEIVDKKSMVYKPTIHRFLKWLYENSIVKDGLNPTEILKVIYDVFASLTPREEKIVRERIGFNFPAKHTQESVGLTLGLTQPRISQIEKNILKRLRHSSRSRRLKAFLEEKE